MPVLFLFGKGELIFFSSLPFLTRKSVRQKADRSPKE